MSRGLGAADFHRIYREEYLHAIELIWVQRDSTSEWDAFANALFSALHGAFGREVAAATDSLQAGIRGSAE